ncbi:MAG TPA: hypothetical protein VNO22_00840 [Planctomycetota bacterium]|nr:hypothetical protein [Planctomycetota bacterium]
MKKFILRGSVLALGAIASTLKRIYSETPGEDDERVRTGERLKMDCGFYPLDKPDSTRQWVEWSDEVDLETVKCPTHPGHQRPGKRLTNLSVVLPKVTMDDFVWTWMSDCLIKESVVEVLKRGR